MAEIGLEGVTKIYPDGTEAVSSLDLDISDGEFVVLVGPSGCGKTSALRMVAGLEEISGGTVRIGNRVVNRLSPGERDVAMVFQSYALYPHLSVYDNLAYGLRRRRMAKPEIDRRVREAAGILGIDELLGKKPRHLSGGQRQRVAMGRAMVREPQAFLLDEPLSNLDAKLRVQMRAEIARIQRALGVTTIYVTHDQTEALTMGDRIAVLRKGVLQQVDTPEGLYGRPANLFVASFIGSPAMNLLEAQLVRSNGSLYADVGGTRLPLSEATLAAKPGLRRFEGSKVLLGIRPEHLEDASLVQEPAQERLPIVVDLRESVGSDVYVHFQLPTVDRSTTFVARLAAATAAREGGRLELHVDTQALHFFDPVGGAAIYESEREAG